MEGPLKELERLNKLVSEEPSMGKSKTPAIQDSLNSLLQTLRADIARTDCRGEKEGDRRTPEGSL